MTDPKGLNTCLMINNQPKVICTCDIFGQGQMVITFTDVGYGVRPVPNRWIRFWTRVFFNSKWEFLNE